MKRHLAWLLCISFMSIHAHAAEFIGYSLMLTSHLISEYYSSPAYGDQLKSLIEADDIPAIKKELGWGFITHPDTLTSRRTTPLMYAESKEMVDYLVSRKANVNFKTASEMTPLRGAILNRCLSQASVIQALLDNKADINACNNDGATVLFYAVKWQRSTPIVKLLLERKANQNAITNYGETPLMKASTREHVSLLLEHKAAIDRRDFDGNTALIHAAQAHFYDAVRALLEHKADPAITNTEGNKAFDFADSMSKDLIKKAITERNKR
jgi:ankyrin repeat protein